MKIGILSDSHNHVERIRMAVQMLQEAGANVLVHCGDLATTEIVTECSVLPFYFVLGNHDADNVPALRSAQLSARQCALSGQANSQSATSASVLRTVI